MQYNNYNWNFDIDTIRAELERITSVPYSVLDAITVVNQSHKNTFLDIEAGDVLYQIVETKASVDIVDRRVISVTQTGKKTHLCLAPVLNLLSEEYYPYSNKTWTMSKKLQPLFIKLDDALFWLDDKLYKDAKYYNSMIERINTKRRWVDNKIRRLNYNVRVDSTTERDYTTFHDYTDAF
jgi:hypothetical protein